MTGFPHFVASHWTVSTARRILNYCRTEIRNFEEKSMSIADDLTRLEQMRDRETLSADEFQRAKNKLLSTPYAAESALRTINGFRRSTNDRWIGGVCGGLAASTGVEAWLWRMMFAFLLLAGGSGLIAYVILWIFVPLEPTNPMLRSSS
jgi:phage shock protein C